jgi:hypothetical protein
MSKTGKTVGIVAGALIVVAGVAAAVVLGQLGRLIENGVEKHGPGLTGTDVDLGSARVSIFSGEGELKSLSIDNPEGFSDDKAFDLGRIRIAVDPKSLASDVVHIRQIVVDGPKLLAEFDASGRSNLNAILDHVRAAAGGGKGSGGSGDGAGKKMIIDEFRFENAEARAFAPAFNLDKTVKVPPVVLKELGKRQGGAAAADIANQVMRPIVDGTVKAASREYLRAQRDKAKTKLLDKILK